MLYSENFKRKMVQKLTGPNAVSATSLSKRVDVPQPTLSKWLRNAGIVSPHTSNNIVNPSIMRPSMSPKRPEDWSPEEKLKLALEAASLSDQELGAFLRRKGIHETHLQQWRLQMLSGLGNKKPAPAASPKRSVKDTKRIRELEKELKRKDKALAETAALLVLKKKAQEIWGDGEENIRGRNGR